MLNEKIFKAYDVRGIYPQELNEESARVLGKAFSQIIAGSKKVVIGRDMRLASESLLKEFSGALISAGYDIDDIGLAPVDAFYYTYAKRGYDAGVYATASHNPKEYHGFKMLKQKGVPVTGEEMKSEYEKIHPEKAGKKGSLKSVDIFQEFIGHLLSFCNIKNIRPLRVVVDAGNGMAGKVIPELEKRLPIHVTRLFFELDGNFPNHPSNPLEKESQIAIRREVIERKADFGVIFDGDTDRLFFIDEKGNFIRADITLIYLAKHFLEKYPGSGVVYNAICTHAVREFVEAWGGKPHRSKVGWVNVRNEMMKRKAVLGGEVSAHYNFQKNFYSDSGFIAFLIVLELLSKETMPLSQAVKEFYRYAKSDEMNLKLENIPAKLEAVKMRYASGIQDFLDGITVGYPDFWFNARPSNTEPLLRVTLEAKNQKILEEKTREIIEFIENV